MLFSWGTTINPSLKVEANGAVRAINFVSVVAETIMVRMLVSCDGDNGGGGTRENSRANMGTMNNWLSLLLV